MTGDLPRLTPRVGDEILAGDRKLWGAETIAAFLGVSVAMVYDLAKDPEVPICKPPGSGRYFALKSDLLAWLRTKPTEEVRTS